MPRIVLFGPPACGKGTQAAYLKKRFGIPHVSTGDLFREHIRNGTKLGREAKRYIDAGRLVPDEVTIGMVKERLEKEDCRDGFVLDGFPRTVPQAEALASLVPIDHAIFIDVPFEEVVDRITGRRSCPTCGRVYHIRYNPPPPDGRCGTCGSELVIRSDDTEEKARARWEVFLENRDPLLQYYRERGILHCVDGARHPDEVAADITAVLET